MRVINTLLIAAATTASALVGATDVASSTTTYNLLHRVGSFDKAGEWSVRATIELATTSQSATIPAAAGLETNKDGVNVTKAVPASAAGSKFISTIEASDVKSLYEQALSAEASDLVYQLALSPADSPSSLQGLPTTSIKLCHLRQSHADLPSLDDQVTVHLRRSAPAVDKSSIATPYGLSYRVLDIQLGPDGCPVPSGAKIQLVREEARKERQRQAARRSRRRAGDNQAPSDASAVAASSFTFKTDLHLSTPSKPSTPPLKAPLPTREDGTVQPPEPEKTLLQKYWFYLIPVAVLILMPVTEDDPDKQGAESHPSSEAVGKGMGAKRLK